MSGVESDIDKSPRRKRWEIETALVNAQVKEPQKPGVSRLIMLRLQYRHRGHEPVPDIRACAAEHGPGHLEQRR